MNRVATGPFFVTFLSGSVVQCVITLLLWLLLPLNITSVTGPGWDATYITHSSVPLFACFVMALFLLVLAVAMWRRHRARALGLALSVPVGTLLGLVLMLQDSA